MKELALQVYKDINQHSDHLHSRAEWGFRDLDKLLDLLDEYGISVIEISNPHDWQLHFEYTQESRSDVNFFMIWCKARGKLNEIKCLVHPQAKEIESDWLARRTYRSQPNTKKKSTRNQNVRLGFDGKKISSVSDDFEFTNLDCTSPNDGSKLNGWRAEKYAFQYLRTELLSEISEEYDHNWEDIQYVFKSKGKEIAKLIWHDRYLIEGAEEVNNPGFDIEKVYDNKSTYYEIKSGTNPSLTLTQQQFAMNVGERNYIVFHVDLDLDPPTIQPLPYWDRLKKQFEQEEENGIDSARNSFENLDNVKRHGFNTKLKRFSLSLRKFWLWIWSN